jgi:hypothetical protein
VTPSSSSLSRTALLRLAAFVILFLGLALAVRIDQAARSARSGQQDPDILAADPLSPTDSKHYGYQMGQLSGPVGVLFSHFTDTLSSLSHGRPLAILIALTSFAAAGALLVLADKASPSA